MPGTYVGLKFSTESLSNLKDYISENQIKTSLTCKDFHTTLMYSRRTMKGFVTQGELDPPIIADPAVFQKWKLSNGNFCLVLVLACPYLEHRHLALMDLYNATYDFDRYYPHVTLSYDVNGLNIDRLPKFKYSLEFVQEFKEKIT